MPNRITLSDLNINTYREAFDKGLTLSSYLEMNDPSPEGSKIDAFGRLMKEAGIITQSIPERNIFTPTGEAFLRTTENKALFPEYTSRTVVNRMREFPLYRYLVANRTPINSNTYKGAYIDMDEPKNKKATEMRRIVEASDIPLSKITPGKRSVEFYKYGRGLEVSYEVLRRSTLDLVKVWLEEVADSAAENKVAEIIDTIKDGDGNSNAAPVVKMTDLVTGTTKLDREVWVRFLLQFYGKGGANTIVANIDGLLQILEVLYPTVEVAGKMDELLANGLTVQTTMPQNLISNMTLLYSPDLEKVSGKEAIMALNRDRCISELVEVGSLVNEADKFIRNQTEIFTVTENSGFMKMTKDSARILTL